MDFDILPEPAFLRIFDYLPLEDRFRVGRVSHSFRRISQIVNGRIKSLDLDDSMFKDLDEEQFEVILNGCLHKLREIKLRLRSGILASKFSEFTCPQLVNLDLNHNLITDDEFARIVTNHPNLKSLKWSSLQEHADGEEEIGEDDDNRPFLPVVFPPVTLPNLETLHIQTMNNETVERLIDRCPNLKILKVTLYGLSSDDILDGFFRSVPRLESLRLTLDAHRVLMENLEWFWHLPLTSLKVTYDLILTLLDDDDLNFAIRDDFVYKLIESFKNIEYLDLELQFVSADAVAALTGLKKLRVAKLYVKDDEFTDGSIREFSACRSLEGLYVPYIRLSEETFLELFRNCPHLRKLHICGLYDGNNGVAINAETAGMRILELANVPRRPSITIEISFRGSSSSYQKQMEVRSVWESIQVQNAERYLQETHGIEIDICFVGFAFAPPVDEVMEQVGDSDVESDNQVDDGQMDEDQGGGNQPDA